MSDEKLNYYDVAIATDKSWSKNILTYSSPNDIAINTVVSVPFSRTNKLGFIVKKSTKPGFKTKDIIKITNFQLSEATLALMDWQASYYPGLASIQAQYFLPSFVEKIVFNTGPEIQKIDSVVYPLPKLTKHQKLAVEKITSKPEITNILHGITGSGKTRVYEELIHKTLESGKNVLVLIPEISLSSQISTEISKHFGKDRVHTYNSKQAISKQKKTWVSAATSEQAQIYIGPRSALFLPFDKLGLIVIDESHESSYKQSNGDRYNGLIVAAALAKIHRAKFVLGSATPPVSETHQLIAKGAELVCMHALAKEHESKRKFTIVDMTEKSNYFQTQRLLSKQMIEQIKVSLDSSLQVLIFFNRRGTSRLIICHDCGWSSECEKCGMPNTYHHDKNQFQCHVCGVNLEPIYSCPKCSAGLNQENPGIKSLTSELNSIFPSAKIERYDSDNKKSESFNERYLAVKNKDVDIIIGTQIVTKGIDLPHLSLVCVINTDSNLALPDFTSSEKTFQQLTQVAGRVGRGHRDGSVILQTYNPTERIFEYIQNGDWHNFYKNELNSRKENNFPPFVHMLKLNTSKKSSDTARKTLEKVMQDADSSGLSFLGPAPSFHEKSNGVYNWQIVVRSKSRNSLIRLIKSLPKDVFYDLDPIGLL